MQQNDYCGITKWNDAGITGKGVYGTWKMGKPRQTDHPKGTPFHQMQRNQCIYGI